MCEPLELLSLGSQNGQILLHCIEILNITPVSPAFPSGTNKFSVDLERKIFEEDLTPIGLVVATLKSIIL